MARGQTIKFLRTTRANLETQKGLSNLIVGEPYLITDENRIAIATAVNAYYDFALKSENDAKVTANAGITGATKTKITYDAKGLVTGGADATTADIADSTNKRYVTDANLTVIGNTSGTNTGDQTLPVKASASEINTGTDDAKFATALAIMTSKLPSIIKTKSANEEVQNSTTLQDDDHLFFTAKANTTYAIQIQLILRSLTGSNGGIKMSVNAPTGSSVEIGSLTVFMDPTTHVTAGYNSGIDAYVTGTQTGSGGTSEGSAHITVWVSTSSTTGTIQFRFAQATADNSGAIRVNKGSQLTAWEQ